MIVKDIMITRKFNIFLQFWMYQAFMRWFTVADHIIFKFR